MTLSIWTVYDHPTDFPDWFVARLWIGEEPTDQVLIANDLGEVRAMIAEQMPGAVLLMRQPNDDPTIVEVWI